MAIEIEVKWCQRCGNLERLSSRLRDDGSRTVTVGCRCGAETPRAVTIPAGETYSLLVEAKMEEAKAHDDPDTGNVQAGAEARGAGDA